MHPTTRPTTHPTTHPTMLSVGLDPTGIGTSPSSRAVFGELDHDTIRAQADAGYAELRSLGFELNPSAILVFDTGPATKAQAIRRWFPRPDRR